MTGTADDAVRNAMAAYSEVQTTAATTLDATDLRLMSAVSQASVALDALRDIFPAALFEPLVQQNLELVEQVESAIVTLLPMPQPVNLGALDQTARPASSLQLVQTKATEMTASLEKLLIPRLTFSKPSGENIPQVPQVKV
ncbi:hypothetical protein K523DRAFT_242764 [Schizophyllum commune Tattone D]|nr:hypothetical protein K523DRAFT_242764 [Schizophyllum commune Tattone D]